MEEGGSISHWSYARCAPENLYHTKYPKANMSDHTKMNYRKKI